MLTAVFAFQPLGQLAAAIITLICVSAARGSIVDFSVTDCARNDACVRTVDTIWRVIIGLGAVPAAFALYFRLTIIESPLYTLDVAKDSLKATADVFVYYTGARSTAAGERPAKQSTHTRGFQMESLSAPTSSISPGSNTATQRPSNEDGADHRFQADLEGISSAGSLSTYQPIHHNNIRLPEPVQRSDNHSGNPSQSFQSPTANAAPPRRLSTANFDRSPLEGPGEEFWTIYWRDFKKHYWHDGNLRTLFATALCWGCLDLPFYGLGTSDTVVLGQIWSSKSLGQYEQPDSVYIRLYQTAWQSILIVQIWSIVGVLTTLFTIRKLGARWIQMIGFGSLFVLFVALGGSYNNALNNGRGAAVVVLYALCNFFFNFGELD